MAHINVQSWQGDHKKAQEASFLKRCVKKTRDPCGELTPVLICTVPLGDRAMPISAIWG